MPNGVLNRSQDQRLRILFILIFPFLNYSNVSGQDSKIYQSYRDFLAAGIAEAALVIAFGQQDISKFQTIV